MENFAEKHGTLLVDMFTPLYKVVLLYTNGLMMIDCCNDGTRPVIFKIERIDIPENVEEKQWLEKQNFKNTEDDAYIG